jgi:hypothetical protein
MRQGLTANIHAIIEQVAQLDCIKPYILCGGTALAMQIGHRKSEDLDFMMWRLSKTEKPEVNWNLIEKELKENIGEIENFNMLGFDQVEFLVKGVKFSFFVSDNYSPVSSPVNYLGNIRLADIDSILAMKMEVMLRRMKFRDYSRGGGPSDSSAFQCQQTCLQHMHKERILSGQQYRKES